jgi:hypothetical protein
MNDRIILLCLFLCAFATASAAQQPSDRTDLNAIAGRPSSNEVAFAISFVESPPVCPEALGALQISGGPIWFIQSLASRGNGNGTISAVSKPIDDETYQIRISTYDCLIDATLRTQALRDGRWTPLLVPKSMRPSMSAQERAELVRPSLDRLQEQLKNRVRASAEASNNWLQGRAPLARVIRIQNQTGGVSTFYELRDARELCRGCRRVFSQSKRDHVFVSNQFPRRL